MFSAKVRSDLLDAQEQPGMIFLDGERQAFMKIDAVALQGNSCVLGGWISEPMEICILADKFPVPLCSFESFSRPDVNAYLGTSSELEHGFGLIFEWQEDVTYSLSAGGTVFNLNLDKAPSQIQEGDVNIFGEKNIQFLQGQAPNKDRQINKVEILNKILNTDYRKLNIDLELGGADPQAHFMTFGRKESRNYSYIIDENYIKSLEEYKNNENNKTGIEFFFKNGEIAPNSWLDFDYINKNNKGKYTNWVEIIRDIYNNTIGHLTPFFDESYYVENAQKKGIKVKYNPILHYLSEGWRNGIDFHPYFDTWYFVEKNNIRKVKKPYLLYLFEKTLYEINPFMNISYLNNIIKDEIKGDYNELYKLVFKNEIKINYLHPDLKQNIINYIVSNNQASPPINKTHEEISSFLELARKLNIDRAEHIDLSIIIVNYHKPALTLFSIYSVLLATKNISHEIILVENESDRFETEILYRYLENYSNIHIITLKENVFFGEANNIAIEKSKGKLVLFINNDAFIPVNTLGAMIKSVNDEVGAVSAIAINHENKIVEAGGTITEWNDTIQNLKGRKYDRKLQDSLARERFRDVDYVSAACVLIKKEFLDKFGGFDQIFEPFYYEDTDLCKRLTANGYKIRLLTDCTYLHLENASTQQFLKERFDQVVSRSRSRFLEKWDAGNCISEIQSKQPINHKITAAIYTPFKINPGGGENYLLSIMAAIGNDFHIFLITPSYVSRYRVLMVAQQLGISLPPFDLLTEDETTNIRFDILITIGNSIVPERIFASRVFYYHCQFPFPLHYTAYHSNRSDLGIEKYICNSEYTKREIEREIKRYKLKPVVIEVLNPPVRTSHQSVEELLDSKNNEITFITVGRFIVHGHRKNQDKILQAMMHVSKNHKLHAYIYGALGPNEEDRQFYQAITERNTHPDIILDADVSNETIREAYRRSHFYIHAAGLDTAQEIKNSESEHFGISLVEAMSYGCVPIVCGHGGPKEILADSGVGFQYQSLSELFAILTHVVSIENFREYFAENARKSIKIASRFDISNFNGKIKKLLAEAREKLKK